MPINTYERARSRTQAMIIDATVDLILADGYENLSISRIADAADVGRGTFYRYFESIDAVLLQIFQEISRELYASVETVLRRYESPEREQKAWIAAFEHLEQYMPLFQKLQGSSLALWEGIAAQNLAGFAHSLRTNDVLYAGWMNLPMDVMAHFTSGAIMAVIKGWFSGELQYSGKELGLMVFKLLYHQAPG